MPLGYGWEHGLLTGLGTLWTGLTIWLLLSQRGQRLLRHPAAIPVAAALLACSLGLVLGEIARVEAMAGGLRILDGRLRYSSGEAMAFAEALGLAGRARYAVFQLSFDMLAPPAFACFAASIASRLLAGKRLLMARGMILLYLGCVLPANTLMPVYMLNYPASGWQSLLVQVVPKLDFGKYCLHGLVWLLMLFSGLEASLRLLTRGHRPGDAGSQAVQDLGQGSGPDATLKA